MRLISTIVDATARVPKRVESNQSLEPGPAALIESNLAERDISMRAHGPPIVQDLALDRVAHLRYAECAAVPTEDLRRVAFIQLALVAVREELAAHEPKVGGGSEQPLD